MYQIQIWIQYRDRDDQDNSSNTIIQEICNINTASLLDLNLQWIIFLYNNFS